MTDWRPSRHTFGKHSRHRAASAGRKLTQRVTSFPPRLYIPIPPIPGVLRPSLSHSTNSLPSPSPNPQSPAPDAPASDLNIYYISHRTDRTLRRYIAPEDYEPGAADSCGGGGGAGAAGWRPLISSSPIIRSIPAHFSLSWRGTRFRNWPLSRLMRSAGRVGLRGAGGSADFATGRGGTTRVTCSVGLRGSVAGCSRSAPR